MSYEFPECEHLGLPAKWCNKIECRTEAVWCQLCLTRPGYYEAFARRKEAIASGVRHTLTQPKPHQMVHGVGTELKNIIAWWQKRFPMFDLGEKSGCGCRATANWMNSLGPDGCEKKLEQILDKLEAEADKRKLSIPFQRTWARMMVKAAIRRSRKNTRSRDANQI
jgi:hypothetical protein